MALVLVNQMNKSPKPEKPKPVDLSSRVDELELSIRALEALHFMYQGHLKEIEQRALQLQGRSGLKARIRWIILGK